MGYDSQIVLRSIDEHVFLINAFMSICVVTVFIHCFKAIAIYKRSPS